MALARCLILESSAKARVKMARRENSGMMGYVCAYGGDKKTSGDLSGGGSL
jgi:hypothetical protein